MLINSKNNYNNNKLMTAAPLNNLDIIHPHFLNGWCNYGDVYDEAVIYKNKDGLVTMNGLVKGNYKNIIFRLPEGWKPNKQLIFAISSDNISRRLDINSNGELYLNTNGYVGTVEGNGWVSLSGISYYATH